ncbi:PQQ-dependent sugar dehydrogenase [Vibrio sp. JPW-9-11-11]|uniref:PQQ-dependent sugar dehydrogenase n=1 Tax=Vibrio sp. JPW-9-11-11 TaxID=1416532 RepID=UPI001592D78B|nr:PQQ-dependent sugar dehydrogenase [Vibrio sp. JPW-9-11-11]NVD06443.1 PQQ-dependent sugar dehydrogenase [Vibrio sp. JPW-9-11-11]
MNKLLFGLLLCLAYPSVASTQWRAEPIVSGLTIPWGLSAIDSNRVLVSEKNGTIGLLDLATNTYQTITTVPNALEYGQGGLLDIAISPFNPNHIYVTYTKKVGQEIETTLARAELDGKVIGGWRELLVTKSGSDGGRHFGSRITFDNESVYFSVGDRGERDNGQDRQTHAGSILRLTPDGQVPNDNPYIDDDKVLSEIWSYGHRNPQGLFFDSQSKQLWSIEHGPRGGDEINLIAKGKNYGWPITSHGKEYWGPLDVGEAEEKPGIESPIKVYVPSIAPGSLVMYRGERFPELDGKLLAGALKLTHINIISLARGVAIDEQRILQDLGERVRDIEVLPNGEIIFSSDSGRIFRLVQTD